ncbi:MAG: 4-alpha-glucanotransferase [Melioribacteraceae bacterium]|jgi:4-alpha-glucanotransferase|nr:4-alpha-glucanotransferase [Melioribacteraceae bacterium]
MKFERSAGILLHPTSLPSKYGIGDLGKDAFYFIDFLAAAKQTIWQVFPLGPTGYGDSPYQCFSAFAGNPLLISPDLLAEEGLLSQHDLENIPHSDPNKIDFGQVINYKKELLVKAFENYKHKNENGFNDFCEINKNWLDDFALFMAVKDYHNGILWTEWSEDIAFRKKGAVEAWTKKLEEKIFFQKFIQYKFFMQWGAVKDYANSKGIKIMGDLPIFIAYDSSDLWANKDLFTVDEHGKLETVAGVPPDYFSETGQLWGNPLYKWEVMKKHHFRWWKDRFKQMYELVDIVRIDHFRGFDAFWEIPGDAPTAQTGKWVDAPGRELFKEIKKELGDVPIVAEDLGVITESVEELRDMFEFPGMKILQFGFGPNGDNGFLPHNHVKNCVVYSGSHDNDTTKGFFENERRMNSGIYEWTQKYLNYYGEDIVFAVIKAAYASVANTTVIPLQDMLNLGTEARMNFPGKLGGNWTWRFTWEQITEDLASVYAEMVDMYDRNPKKVKKA